MTVLFAGASVRELLMTDGAATAEVKRATVKIGMDGCESRIKNEIKP